MSCNYFIIEKAVVHEILFSLSGKGGVLLMAGPRRALAVWRPGLYGAPQRAAGRLRLLLLERYGYRPEEPEQQRKALCEAAGP